MKKITSLLFILTCLSGCCAMFNYGSEAIIIDSNVNQANVILKSESGEILYKDTTPFIADLNKKLGYFSRDHYQLIVEKEGYTSKTATLSPSISTWFWFNLLTGGTTMLIDGATKNMWTFSDDRFVVNLEKK